jgi:RimJ/RimL family protein N-acetyltransferase
VGTVVGVTSVTDTTDMTQPSGRDSIAWPQRTERLSLRRARTDDAALTWPYRRREDVARWLPMLPVNEQVHRETFCAPRRLATTLVVELRGGDGGAAPGGVIGDVKFDIGDGWAQDEILAHAQGVQAEIGWVFDPVFHGRGYATEAVREVMRLAFAELGLRRVEAYCFAENEPSWRLMERVGMRREAHTIADGLHRDGTWRDGLAYALLADEWRAAQSRRS